MTEFTSGFDPSVLNANQQQPGYTTNEYGQQQQQIQDNNNYQQYASATDEDPNYHSNPFTAMATQEANVNYQQPSY